MTTDRADAAPSAEAKVATSGRYVTEPDNFIQAPVRWLSGRLARALLLTPITPNQVTVTRGVLNAVALACFVEGSYRSFVVGFALFQVFELLDHVDGDLARLRGATSRLGALMEAFVDAYGARPSNLFGLCIVMGMMLHGDGVTPLFLFTAIAIGRLLWLEYRGPFGWSAQRDAVFAGEHGHYLSILRAGSARRSMLNLAVILYTWQNQFILWGGLLRPLAEQLLKIDSLWWSLAVVALLNHLPWMTVVGRGFRRALARGGGVGG